MTDLGKSPTATWVPLICPFKSLRINTSELLQAESIITKAKIEHGLDYNNIRQDLHERGHLNQNKLVQSLTCKTRIE